MGLGKLVRKISRVFGHDKGGGSTPQPAPELELIDPNGEAEEKKETTKKVLKRGKKALKISKNDTPPIVSAGRNIV